MAPNSNPRAAEYILNRTKFGKTQFYSIYLTCVNFLENILTIFILIPFNIMVLIKYRRFIKKKSISRIVIGPIQKLKFAKECISQKRFTKMILIFSFTFILSRLGEASARIVDIFNKYLHEDTYLIYCSILNILVEFNTYIIFSLNFFIYYFFNKPFRNCFKSMISFKKYCVSIR